jgi:tetratricopeptide (TPR) repeat protein
MTNNRLYAAIFAVLMLPLAAVAEEDENETTEFESPLDQTVPVAVEAVVQEQDAVPDEISEEMLLEEFARYRRLVGTGTLDEADIAAKRIVEMAIKIYGPRSRETASALNNLGIVQHGNGQYDAAIQNFSSAIEIIELAEDRLHDALINPLKGLGAAQLAIGRPDKARQTFERAAHITHVNDGPHNIDQVEILESLVETYIRMGDPKSARDILDRIHIVNVKFFEQDPMGLLPTLMTRAEWQHRAGYYADERVTYRRTIRIIESSQGDDSPLLVEPLRRLGESFYFADLSMATPQQQGTVSTGEVYFKRAVRIAEKAEDMDWRESARTRMALADYYNYTNSQNRARTIYTQTWDFLSADEERIAVRDELFANPSPIREEVLPAYAGGGQIGEVPADELLQGKVTVTYNVSSRGRIRDLKTEVDPPEFTDMQVMVHREVRRRLFRPRFIDGKPVDAENIVFEHEFFYTQADLDALKADQEES